MLGNLVNGGETFSGEEAAFASKMLNQTVNVTYKYETHFTRKLFDKRNRILIDVIDDAARKPKLLVIMEAEATKYSPGIADRIVDYAKAHNLNLVDYPIELAGGEKIKQSSEAVEIVLKAVDAHRIDRHSYVVAIGGGALLDAVGFAAATAHRGVRLIRVPTTVLAQDDSGVGVKNAINYFGKKNFLGTFAPPVAVLNDFDFLDSLPDRDWRGGMAEAVKVALIKDEAFFERLENDAPLLASRNQQAMEDLVYRCAELHLNHIASGDAFEMGSARPLDFGHWAAHKLEAISNYRLRHGEAVAIGITLDCIYSRRAGWFTASETERVIELFLALGFELWAPELDICKSPLQNKRLVLDGLEEFREHLGGELTVTMLKGIGQGFEVHRVDEGVVDASLCEMKARFAEQDASRHYEAGQQHGLSA